MMGDCMGLWQVYSCAVLKDPGSGQNRGYGFIKFKSKEIAQKAMAKLNDTEMKDHPGFKVPAPRTCLFCKRYQAIFMSLEVLPRSVWQIAGRRM